MRLIDMSIRALKAPEKGVTVYSDDTLTGFGVRVSQAGTKAYEGQPRGVATLPTLGVCNAAMRRLEGVENHYPVLTGTHNTS